MKSDPSHWDAAHRERSVTGVSWFQATPAESLRLIDPLGLSSDAPIIDVGGGASVLVDALISRGFTDLTVLDVSEVALNAARDRLGDKAEGVVWLCEDVLQWEPSQRYALWHDRAVYHFLVEAEDRRRYAKLLKAGLDEEGVVVMATFAPDGPERCSGLPVARYGPVELVAELGDLSLVKSEREEHVTPAGGIQPFTWVVAR
jgi:hypothetical protein